MSIVETAARLARERLAPRAAEYDRDAKNPVDSWRDLWRDGLLGATIPRARVKARVKRVAVDQLREA